MAIIYTSTIFISAFLIFLVQPMMAKVLLPFLGGASSVWNTSMVFYQLLLLGGYLYAHLGLRFFGAKRQAVLHIVLLLLSLFMLPLALNTGVEIIATEQPIWWLLSALFLSVGLPFFLLSANAPLLQSWFARTTHKKANNPYFLYSASNLGSFIALLGYPIIFEPFFGIPQQMWGWSVTYTIFTALLVICTIILHKHYLSVDKVKRVESSDNSEDAPKVLCKLHWVALAFIPSSLMLGVTSYITTDIASIPLLWIIPLALYLLTFVFAFASGIPMYERSLNAQFSLVLLVTLLIAFDTVKFAPIFILHLFMFFAIAMVCHGQLAKTKPSPQHLTEFFLWISVGGVLGGMFNALIAPVIFDSVIEYQIVLALSCFFRPLLGIYKNERKEKYLDFLLPLLLFFGLVSIFAAYNYVTDTFIDSIKLINEQLGGIRDTINVRSICAVVLIIAFAFVSYKFHKRPFRFGFAIVALFIAVPIMNDTKFNILHVERNFFGVLTVKYFPEKNYHSLMHGTTLHGIQRLGEKRLIPTTYYGPPLKEIFTSLDKQLQNEPVALVGLGSGTTACYGKENQQFDFYDINQAVEHIATNKDYFTYLSDCPPKIRITIGDGRLEIAKAKKETYGLIIMDAFSSDSIPIHLMTSEALAIYLDKLQEKGLIAFHISNRHLNLAPVLSSLAEEKGLSAVVKSGERNKEELIMASQWVVLARDNLQLKKLTDNYGWKELEKSELSPWTDKYSNILQIMF